MAYIISGVKKKSKVVIGKASIRIPFFERLDKLNLRLIPIDVKTSNAVPTADYININVDATVNVKISNDPEKLRLAAENFLNKNTEYIASVAREVLEGNVREIVGKMRLEEMVSDRQKFANLVKENAEPNLAAMGWINVPVVMAKVFESMKEATGIDLADIINAESYDAKVNRNVNVSGLDSVNFVVKDDGTKVTMAKVEPQNSTKPVSTDVPESGEQG